MLIKDLDWGLAWGQSRKCLMLEMQIYNSFIDSATYQFLKSYV